MPEIKLLLCYAAAFLLFWLPASLLVRRLAGPRHVAPAILDLFTLVAALVAAYLVFWVYLVGHVAGHVLSWMFLAAAVAWIAWECRGGWRPIAQACTGPTRLAFLCGLLYLSGLSLYGGVDRAQPFWFIPNASRDSASCHFWLMPRSIDSVIPLKYACAIADHTALRGEIGFGDWRFSDRPPLQTGVLLLLWPLTAISSRGILGQAVGAMLQVQWIVAGVAMVWALGWRRRLIAFAVITVALSGFVYFSSIYVWPKFLTGALCFAACTPLICAWRQRRRLSTMETMLAAAASALAFLAHGSAVFSLLPMCLLAACHRKFFALRTLGLGAAVALLLYAPWSAYQKWADPPGTRCIKWMLTGQTQVNNWSSLRAIREAYGDRTIAQWRADRWENFNLLFADEQLDKNMVECVKGMAHPRNDPPGAPSRFIQRYYFELSQLHYDAKTLAALLRYDQVEQTFRALGLLNLAWPILLWQVFSSRRRRRWRRECGLLCLFTLLNLLLWWLLIFDAGVMLIRSGSHGMMLALFLLAAAVIYRTPPLLRWTIFGMHLAANIILWWLLVPTDFAKEFLHLAAKPQIVPLLGIVVSAASIVWAWRGNRIAYSPRRLANETERKVFGIAPPTRATAALAAFGLLFIAVAATAISRNALASPPPPDDAPVRALAVWIRPEALCDGVMQAPAECALVPVVPFGDALDFVFPTPKPLREIRLHFCESDRQTYRFHIRMRTPGQWHVVYRGPWQPKSSTTLVLTSPSPEPILCMEFKVACPDKSASDAGQVFLPIRELELVPQ